MTKSAPALLLIILIVSLILGSSILTRGHYWGDDFASYIMQAKSILNGTTQEFVAHNSFTIFESSYQIGPVTYPWGYPLILVPFYAIKGNHPLVLKLPGLIFYAGFLCCLYMLMKNRLTQTENLLFVALFAFNTSLLIFLDNIFADVPFSFFIMLALLCALQYKESKRNTLILGAVLFFAFFMRTTGIILVLSFLLYQGIRYFRDKEGRGAIFTRSLQSMFVFGMLWLITSFLFPDEQGSYVKQLSGLTLPMIKESASYYFYLFGTFFGNTRIWELLYYILVVFFLIGVWTRYPFDQLFVIFFALYMGTLLLWPAWQGIRFILPLLPLFIYFVFQGMKFALSKMPAKFSPTGQWGFYGFWSLMIAVFLFNSSAQAYTNLKDHRAINGAFDPFSQEVYEYIQTKTPVDSVVIFFKPRLMRLMTNRDSIMILDCGQMLKGDYYVLKRNAEKDDEQISLDDLRTCNLHFDRVFRNRRFFIYKIQR
jgi:hypothetical protein